MHWTYYALFAVCAFAYWQRVPAVSRVATVFLGNAAIVTSWAWFINPTIDPVVQLIVDTVSAFIIMADWDDVSATKEQGWIGFIFGARIGSSLAFIHAGVPEAVVDYWSLMNMLAQVMLAVLLIWSEANGGQFSNFCRRFGRIFFRGGARNLSNK